MTKSRIWRKPSSFFPVATVRANPIAAYARQGGRWAYAGGISAASPVSGTLRSAYTVKASHHTPAPKMPTRAAPLSLSPVIPSSPLNMNKTSASAR